MTTRLYLVRHGENRANLTKEFSSRKVDYPLTAKGQLQAQQTAEFFAAKTIAAVYTSPLKRARETAEIIAARLGLPARVEESYREVDVGEMEGRPPNAADWAVHDQIIWGWLNGNPDRAFPGGDNYWTLWNRFCQGIVQAACGHASQDVVIVSHGGIISTSLPRLCPGVTPDWVWEQANPNCSVTEIQVDANGGQPVGKLIAWASCTHLSGEAAEFVSAYPLPGDFDPGN
jgi:broad specificity phosphatase PhoE